MTCIAISTRRVTVKKHLSFEPRWTWQRLPKTIPDTPRQYLTIQRRCSSTVPAPGSRLRRRLQRRWSCTPHGCCLVSHSAWELQSLPLCCRLQKHRSRLPPPLPRRLRSCDRSLCLGRMDKVGIMVGSLQIVIWGRVSDHQYHTPRAQKLCCFFPSA